MKIGKATWAFLCLGSLKVYRDLAQEHTCQQLAMLTFHGSPTPLPVLMTA